MPTRAKSAGSTELTTARSKPWRSVIIPSTAMLSGIARSKVVSESVGVSWRTDPYSFWKSGSRERLERPSIEPWKADTVSRVPMAAGKRNLELQRLASQPFTCVAITANRVAREWEKTIVAQNSKPST